MNIQVGDGVHYVAYGTPGGEYPEGAHRAAIITEITPDPVLERTSTTVGLAVFNPTGMFFNRQIPYSEDHEPGTWHWPERA